MDTFLDLDDKSSSPIEQLSHEEAIWQHETEQFTPHKRRFFARIKGMNFNLATVTSIGESGGESSDPPPLGY